MFIVPSFLSSLSPHGIIVQICTFDLGNRALNRHIAIYIYTHKCKSPTQTRPIQKGGNRKCVWSAERPIPGGSRIPTSRPNVRVCYFTNANRIV